MIRFRKKVFVWVLICISLFDFSIISAENDFTNVMKIEAKRKHRNFLTYNSKQAEKNGTNADYDDESIIPYDLGIVVDAVSKLNYSECGRDALVVMEAIKRREKWALQMFDAASKFPVGLLHGAFYQLGNFDECIQLESQESQIQGQYCLAHVELFNKKAYEGRVARSFETLKDKPRNVFNSTMHWGICAPSSCTSEELAIVIREIFVLATDRTSITVRLSDSNCYVKEDIPVTTLEIIYGCFIGVFMVFTVLASVFHCYVIQAKTKLANTEAPKEPKKSNLKEAILCFSVVKTIGKFLQTKSSGLNLECIGGIKFISMLFIIAGHTFLFMVGGPVQNTDFYERESQSLANAIFVNSPLLVDTFLLISGFLMCYLLLIELDKRKGKLNILILYIARYIRLTPSYLVVIGLYCSLLYRIGDGPLWNSKVKLEQERCIKSWWTNILYINNYVNTDQMCMFQSWYLAADYHLFIIAPFIIYPLWKWHRIGKTVLAAGIFISIITPFVITLKEKLDPSFMIFAPEVYDLSKNYYFTNAYIKTHMRAGSYFLGLLVGYILYKVKTLGIKIPKYVVWCGWIVSATFGIISLYSIVIFYYPEHEYNAFEAAVYASLHRIAWCISIGWILIACITDNASIVNKFLSWKPFIPLSRLTYCAYLINGFVEIYSAGSLREGIYMSKWELGSKSLAHIVLTFFGAFLLCILFESPIHGLEKIALRKAKPKESQPSGDRGDNNNVV